MNILELKILFLFIILTSSSLSGLSPIFFGKILSKKISITQAAKKRYLSWATCFGAGVFMYVCFLGLLPEAVEKFDKILDEVSELGPQWEAFSNFPWPFFIVVCGFLFIFTIDKVVHAIEYAKISQKKYSTYSLAHKSSDPTTISLLELNVNSNHSAQKHVQHTETDEHQHGVPSSLIILIALCMHAIFEGMAVGLQTSYEKVVSFSVAILIHEWVMALTFGLTVAKGDISRCKKITYVLTFASAIPFGIAIGIAMQSGSTDITYIVSAVFESFAPGIFLHVIFIEIIATEFGEHHPMEPSELENISAASEVCEFMKKMLFILAGFTLIVIVNLLTPHHHE